MIARRHHGDHAVCRSHYVFTRGAEIPLSRRTDPGRQDRAATSAGSGAGGGGDTLSWRCGCDASRPRSKGARSHPQARVRALLPDGTRHRSLGAVAAHPVPGPGIGGQLRGLLCAWRDVGRSDRSRICCSNVSCPRSAASRRISMSTSSIRGAKR